MFTGWWAGCPVAFGWCPLLPVNVGLAFVLDDWVRVGVNVSDCAGEVACSVGGVGGEAWLVPSGVVVCWFGPVPAVASEDHVEGVVEEVGSLE